MSAGNSDGGPEELRLDPGVVEDEELLAETVDRFIERDRNAADTQAEIGRLHGVLGQIIDDYWWPIWARVEELAVARWADLAVGIAKWAFSEGRRFPVVKEPDQ